MVRALLLTWLTVSVCSFNGSITGQGAAQIPLVGSLVASDLTNMQALVGYFSYTMPKARGYVGSNADDEFPFRLYVTPEDQVIQTLAAQINGVEEAYKVAVGWAYISEQKLNHVAEKWLTPREFLTNTPYYSSNLLRGKAASDCEEQANTLVSLIRAEGIPPGDVRVTLGERYFDNARTGHAWVELLTDGHWMVLDPSCGPYWDDETERLVHRRGRPFSYYASHNYPVLQVHAYYNDTYYLDLKDGSGNAPALWREATAIKADTNHLSIK